MLGLRRLFGGWVVSPGREGVGFLKSFAQGALSGDEFQGFWLHSPPAAAINVPRPNSPFMLSNDHQPDALKPAWRPWPPVILF